MVVAAAILVLLALPAVLSALPTRGDPVTATRLLAAISSSSGVRYSGYAESSGSLSLPVTDQFGSVADLLGGTTQMRVWWRGATDWRLDQVSLFGETDTHVQDSEMVSWNYEANTATYSHVRPGAEVRLPVGADLLPSNLGRRLLSEATDAEVSRLPTRRVAGRTVPGLRLRPAQSDTTIGQVDVWADAVSGIPLRVAVYGQGTNRPALTAQFLDFDTASPSEADTHFVPPDGARFRDGGDRDLTDIINEFGGDAPPQQLAGLPRNDLLPSLSNIGVFGRGVTEIVVAPLPGRAARSIQAQLQKTEGAIQNASGWTVEVGPLSLLLTTPDSNGRAWLVGGTVTQSKLAQVAGALAQRRPA